MYYIEITAGLLTGLASSFHCAAMCGPLNVIMHGGSSKWLHFAVYHTGRILTYILIGLLAGSIGSLFAISWLPRLASILAGIVMLLYFLSDFNRKIEQWLSHLPYYKGIKSMLAAQITGPGLKSKWISGVFNGLLPCGMVYLAATAAALTTHWYTSVIYMLCFGCGTLPVLLLLPIIYKLTGVRYKYLSGVLMLLVAIIFMLRGLGYSNLILGWFGLVDHNACN